MNCSHFSKAARTAIRHGGQRDLKFVVDAIAWQAPADSKQARAWFPIGRLDADVKQPRILRESIRRQETDRDISEAAIDISGHIDRL